MRAHVRGRSARGSRPLAPRRSPAHAPAHVCARRRRPPGPAAGAAGRWEAKGRRGVEGEGKKGKSPSRTKPRPAAGPAAYLRALQIEQRRQPPVDPSEQKVHGCRRTPRSGARRTPPRRRAAAAAAPLPRSRPRLLRARRLPGAARGSGGRGSPLRGLRFHPSIRPALRRPPLPLSVGAPQGRAQAPRPPRRRPAPAAGQSELHSGARARPLSRRRGRQAPAPRSLSASRTRHEVCAESFNASLSLRPLFAASRGRLPRGKEGAEPEPAPHVGVAVAEGARGPPASCPLCLSLCVHRFENRNSNWEKKKKNPNWLEREGTGRGEALQEREGKKKIPADQSIGGEKIN